MFRSVGRTAIADDVLNQFIELLGKGVYKLGERLPSETEMCKALNVSRPLLREVLHALRFMGYLEVVRGKGTYICRMPLNSNMSGIKLRLALEEKQLMQLWELRFILEVQAAGLAAERASDGEIATIWAVFEEYEYSVSHELGDPDIIAASQKFHNEIAKAVHNDMLMEVIASISNLLSISRQLSIQVEDSSQRAVEFHRAIAKAIGERDVEEAKRVMGEHLRDVRNDLMVYLQSQVVQMEEGEAKGGR